MLAADDRQFSALMADVDAWLKAEDVPIFQRSLQAVQVLCKRGGFSLNLAEPLWERIKTWFHARYGERMKVDLSLGYGPVGGLIVTVTVKLAHARHLDMEVDPVQFWPGMRWSYRYTV
jgi:hypothetical protein